MLPSEKPIYAHDSSLQASFPDSPSRRSCYHWLFQAGSVFPVFIPPILQTFHVSGLVNISIFARLLVNKHSAFFSFLTEPTFQKGLKAKNKNKQPKTSKEKHQLVKSRGVLQQDILPSPLTTESECQFAGGGGNPSSALLPPRQFLRCTSKTGTRTEGVNLLYCSLLPR